MKQKVMNHIKNNWQEYASFISMIMLIVLGLIYAFNLNNFDFNYPLAYYGGDDMGGLQDAKLFAEQGWMLSISAWIRWMRPAAGGSRGGMNWGGRWKGFRRQ